ncbi:MAG: glycosyltransferase [Oscillospiraceae bacterium]|jgi:glycosyltransferase involved in cell wall biosynthesis|nr:glycosyltransferase [Oscillospiraceae bacterium]
MKHIVIVSSEPWEAERERVENLASRMSQYDIQFISPADKRGLFREMRFKKQWKKTVSRADLILVSPAARAELLQAFEKPVRPLPDGVDFALFNEASERNLPFPDDLFTVKNPIIGHMGPVDADANLQTIETAAAAHPEWAFVFVGPVRTDVSAWEPFPNVHLLGEKPRKHLPAYISRFDVCINIAKNEGASPQKLYEYLATGKPIVSAPHPAQALDYTEAVYLAGTPEEFILCCKKAIGERDAWKVRKRVEYGRAASWDARVAELERVLKEL